MPVLPEKPAWTQGLFAHPIHWQHLDRYIDAQLRLRGSMLCPHAWGFTEFTIDEQYLGLGKIVLSRAEGILPDGTLFSVGQGQEALALDVAPGLTNQVVTLSLPMNPEGSLESRDEDTLGLSTRYIRVPVNVRDHNAYKDRRGESKTILCGRLDLRLMLEADSDLKGFVTMPVVRIAESRQDKSILLDKDFAPTFLHLQTSPILHGYLREIIGLLGHRADHLGHRVSDTGTGGTAEVGDYMLLQCLNRVEPVFRHLDSIPSLHPEEFYRMLLSLVGELSTFAERGKRPQVLEDYNHGTQYLSFAKLMEMARYVLSMVLEQHAVMLPLQQRKNNIQLAPLHDKNLLSAATFVLVAHADMDQETLRTLLPKQIKIGTPENIRELVNTHLPGVKIRPMPVAPRQIPFHAGKSYFQLDFSSNQRAQLEVSSGCALHVSGTFPGLVLQLWAIKE